MIPEYFDRGVMVYQGDAVDFINLLHADSVQLIWTRPPDGNGSWHKNYTRMEAIELAAAVADAATRVLTPSGVLVISLPLDSLVVPDMLSSISKRTHLQPGPFSIDSGDLTSGTWKFHKGATKENDYIQDRGRDDDLIAAIDYDIGIHTDPGDIVVDPFCGSGEVVEAAVMADRIIFANDTDPGAVEATVTRYKGLLGK